MRRIPEALTEGTFDLLVLGGGITGAGVALDATLRGIRTALIDKGDFASGTSSLSSKLVHGGIRYLEHGDLRLVREALHERRLLLRNAPHLVHPLRFLLPFTAGSRVPPWKWRLGLALYDLLAGRDNIRRSRARSIPQLLAAVPDLRREGLRGGAEYHDARMDDARLCLDVIRTAWHHGAVVANHVEAVAFDRREGTIHGVRAVDRVAGSELSIRARVVLNATGPWADSVRRMAGDDPSDLLQPTKGVHLVVRGMNLDSALLLLHPRDGRVFFVIPWLGKTLIGTTDTEADSSPDGLRTTPEDVAYLLEGWNHHFRLELTSRDVMGSFAGLRPLLKSDRSGPSSRSREWKLSASSSGLLTVAGGKYTTYRAQAEAIVDDVASRLGVRRRSRTARMPLDGAPPGTWTAFRDEATARIVRAGLSARTAQHLVHRYGRRADDVLRLVVERPDLARPIHSDEPDILAELEHQRDCEMAVFPEDSMLRRTRIGLFHPLKSK